MTREEQINAHCIYARFDYNEIFKRGARWADKNISDDNISKFLKLYNDWYIAYEEGKTTDKGFDYIKTHWNDE